MNILRLSTLSLTLAVAVFALSYNPAFADKPICGDNFDQHCTHSEDPSPSGLTYTVDLVGPVNMRGAFEFDVAGLPSVVSATLNKGSLTGDALVTILRPGDDTGACPAEDSANYAACVVWTDVFNLCGLLGAWNGSGPDDNSGPTNLDRFTVEGGDWSVSKGGGRRSISFGFAIPASFSDLTDRDLSASLQLTSDCVDPENDPSCENFAIDQLIPTEAGETITTDVDTARVHLRGKGGVTHQAECHADDDTLASSGSRIVITAAAQ